MKSDKKTAQKQQTPCECVGHSSLASECSAGGPSVGGAGVPGWAGGCLLGRCIAHITEPACSLAGVVVQHAVGTHALEAREHCHALAPQYWPKLLCARTVLANAE